jgi:hypothetical protein
VKNRGDVLGVLFVVMFLLLTAWGNAMAMMIVSAIGCVVGYAVLTWPSRGTPSVAYSWWRWFVAVFGLAVAAAITIVVILYRR